MARDADSINLNIFKEHVLEAISAIRKGYKKLENNIIHDYIKKNQATSTYYAFIKDVVKLLVKEKKIYNRKKVYHHIT